MAASSANQCIRWVVSDHQTLRVTHAQRGPVAGAIASTWYACENVRGSVLGSAYLLLACVPNHPSIFYVVVLYLSWAGSIANAMVYVKGVATWFTGHTALAVGLMMIGLSISSAIVVPILSLVIRQYSWRWGFVTLTALVGLIGLPVVHAWFNEHPTAIRERPVKSGAVWKKAAWA